MSQLRSSDDNRREYFRLDDEIPLEISLLEETDETNSSELSSDPAVQLRSKLYAIDEESQGYFAQICRNFPYIAEYLHGLNRKMDLLLERILDIKPIAARPVNISAGGLAFFDAQARHPGTLLRCSFVLPTHQAFLSCKAEVLSCSPTSEGTFRISTRFVGLTDREEASITRHIFARELEARRKAKGEDEF